MSPKRRLRTTAEPVADAQGSQNTTTRSVWGDTHAATEDALMIAHAKQLLQAGHIDEQMEAELSKPWHKSGELYTKYTPTYLAMHPSYTGQNHDEMPSYETALKHQKARDDAQEQLLADFMAGRIDEHGNPIDGKKGPLEMTSSAGMNDHADQPAQSMHGHLSSKTASEKQEHTGEVTKTLDNSAKTSGQQSTASTGSQKKLHLNRTKLGRVEKATKSQKIKTPTTTSPRPLASIETLHPTATTPTNGTTAPTANVISTSSSSASSNNSSSTRRRKPKSPISPLAPLPNHPSYTDTHYYALLDLCRDRNIPRKGSEQEVRNRLIQDDINIALGKEREVSSGKGGRKVFKHCAPEEMKRESKKKRLH